MMDSNSTNNATDNGNATVLCAHQNHTEIGLLLAFLAEGVFLNLMGLSGLVGNIISMIILSRPQMRSSINFLLISLAISDTILIINAFFLYGLRSIYDYTGMLFHYRWYVFPRIAPYLYTCSLMTQMVTVYLTVTVTMERFVAVCHPLKARSLCTYGRARIAVLCIVVVSVLYNMSRFWEVDYDLRRHEKFNVTVYCMKNGALRTNSFYFTFYTTAMYFLFIYAIPFAALVVFNLAIYRQVKKANRDLQHLSHHQRREIGLATMLFCVVIVFLICNILPMFTNIYEMSVGMPKDWMVQVGNLMVTVNSSVNFIIYVIFGRKFKRIFLRLFCSSSLFNTGRDSPEFQTTDESVLTNTTNIELRISLRRNHLHRASTTSSRNNNVKLTNGNSRQRAKSINRSASPGPCVYYPARSPVRSPAGSPSQLSQTLSTQNDWEKNSVPVPAPH